MADPFDFDSNLRAAVEGAYVLERELLGGGMSRVFLAVERSLNRKVVIKVLPPELAAGVNRERFRREIQMAAQLQHPHIVPLYSAGEHGELLFYTMPFIEGESLKHAIENGATFTPRAVAGILHDVVDALAYAHARGVIHRDIKPGNVLRSGVHAVVTDFGVAKAITASLPAAGVTTSGMAIGTPAYMAPEQLAGDPAADHRVDLYAVGLLAYELLTGVAPFTGASPQATMAAQLTQEPAPIESKRQDVPPAMLSLITRCLAKAPEARPQSATLLLAELEAIVLSSGDFPPAIAPRGNSRVVAMTATAFVIVAGALYAWRSTTTVTRDATAAAADAPKLIEVAPVAPGMGRALITREDSFAIAAQIEKRTGRRATTPAPQPALTAAEIARMVDSLYNERESKRLDSLQRSARQVTEADPMRAIRSQRAIIPAESVGFWARQGSTAHGPDSLLRSPSVGGGRTNDRGRSGGAPTRRRLVITELMSDAKPPDWAVAQHAVVDTLRKFFARVRPYSLVPADSVTWALAQSRTAERVGEMLHAELFASVGVRPAGKDSVSFVVILRDLGSVSRQTSATMPAVPIALPLERIDRLLASVFGELRAIDHSPRITDASPAATAPPLVPTTPTPAPAAKKP